MASGPMTSWQIEGEKVEVVTDFLFLGSKISADGDLSHEPRWLLLDRKVRTNLDSVLEGRDITLPTKVRTVKAVVFQVVIHSCESWIVKKAESWRMDVFTLWCWRRLLEVPLDSKETRQVNPLREINPEYLLEGLMLKLKLQYFGHLMWAANRLENSLILGKTEGRRRRGCQRMRWLDGITSAMDRNLGKVQEMVRDGEGWRAAVLWVAKSRTQPGDWVTTTMTYETEHLFIHLLLSDVTLQIFSPSLWLVFLFSTFFLTEQVFNFNKFQLINPSLHRWWFGIESKKSEEAGMLLLMKSQRFRHELVIEQQQQ